MSWTVEPLSTHHDRRAFRCGDDQLDRYLIQSARQAGRTGFGRVFVLVRDGGVQVFGFYSLSGGEIETRHFPAGESRRMPRHPAPVVRLGRFAIDRSVQGNGLGRRMLMEALSRVLRASRDIGICAVEVHAASDASRAFFERYGFLRLLDDEYHLYLPTSTLGNLAERP